MAEESAVNYWEVSTRIIISHFPFTSLIVFFGHFLDAIQKYGNVAFDSNQKAVLTSCVLRYKPHITLTTSTHNTPVSHRSRAVSNAAQFKKEEDETAGLGVSVEGNSSGAKKDSPKEQGFVNCCFSFTIRRDMVGIPSMIVGNFIKC